MKKKGLALLLALTLTATMVAGCSKSDNKKETKTNETQTNETTDNTPAEDTATDDTNTAVTDTVVGGQIILGDVTEFNGSFIEGWGNNGADAVIKELIGTYPSFYGTAELSKEAEYVYNPTVLVTDPETTMNDDGSKTFKFTLQQDLVWSDGSPITAKDYVGNLMIYASPEIAEIDGSNVAGTTLIGYDEYSVGETEVFAGVNLIDDYTFSVTIKAEHIPTFFEAYASAVTPVPFSVYAPGVEINDDGNGCYLSDNYTSELIKEPMTSERYKPTVTCGPYKFVSYDSTNREVVLVINDKFKGNYEGQKPSIEKVIMKYTEEATQLDELASGNVDILFGISGGDKINAGLDLVDQGKADYATYLRNGYGLLAFHCDFGPTQFASVRQAIIYCLDRTTFCSQYTGGFGSLVHSEYGLGQWMYQERKDKIDSELNPYSYDLAKAKEVLEADGWNLNEKGEAYVEGTDTLRYKNVDGELMACEIQWASSDNSVAQLLATMLPSEMEKAGMKLTTTVVDFPTLLNNYYREGIDEPQFNMYNLGTGFTPVPQFELSYNTGKNYLGDYNTNFWMDDKIMNMGFDLIKTDASDKEGFLDKWEGIMKEINAQVPNIPLYSDEYHTFFNPKVQGYYGNDTFAIGYSLIYMSVSEY
ncbi:ABC transporter substrate-binding protein [Anaerosporobacter sp.]|uniref:ABC transporter substrate-binding protein n=1 Tax=Anaerosporobacter sp. TaxID=1872529 RepID=UPI00286F4900|nr:ABC transporter substrate-binding protein [Anaerosporobacter sp.]